jgi:hypothetical protein
VKYAAAPFVMAALLVASACDTSPEPTAPADGDAAPSSPAESPQPLTPLQAADFPELQSRDCSTVVQFYANAVAAREFGRAALVWNDQEIDSERLETAFNGYASPRISADTPVTEGAAGSLYCTVSGTLTDGGNLARPPEHGELVLRRVNDVPGATPDQLRWTLRSSTFIAPLETSTAH